MKYALIVVASLSLASTACAGEKKFSVIGAMEVGSPETTGSLTPMSRVALAPHAFLGPMRQEIVFKTDLPVGSIVVRTAARKLYFIEKEGTAIAYNVAVGREGFSWSGRNVITRKAEWPDWRPPKEMIAREAAHGRVIPAFVKGGEGNPLGARALYIGATDYRIHGTDKPMSIGFASSSGCIRMRNEDVIELYGLVKTGAKVVVE